MRRTKKKSYQQIIDERYAEISRIRWQFLRRNQHYQNVYDWYINQVKSAEAESQKKEIIRQGKQEVWEEYGINDIYDYRNANPSKRLLIEGENLPVQRGTIEDVFEDKLSKDQIIGQHYLIETREIRGPDGFTKTPILIEKYVNIVINCDFNLEEILKDVGEIYYRTMDVRKKVLNVTRLTKLNTEKINELTRCLKVYDLRQKGQKWTSVGKQVYPKHALNSSLERVRKNYDKACRLISRDYRKIVI